MFKKFSSVLFLGIIALGGKSFSAATVATSRDELRDFLTGVVGRPVVSIGCDGTDDLLVNTDSGAQVVKVRAKDGHYFIDDKGSHISMKVSHDDSGTTQSTKSINHASVKIVEAIKDEDAKVEEGCAASKKVIKSTKTRVTAYRLPGIDEPYNVVRDVLGEKAVYTFSTIQYIRLDGARDHHGHPAFNTTIYHGSGTVTIIKEGDRRFCSGFQWIKYNSDSSYILDKETATKYAHLEKFLSGGNEFILPDTVRLLGIDASNPWKSAGKAVEAAGRGIRDAVKDLLK